MYLVILSIFFLLCTLGMFSWLVYERVMYYKTGKDSNITKQYIAALIAVFCLFIAIAMYGWSKIYS